LVGWQEGHAACKKSEWWDAGVVMSLGEGADLYMAKLMPMPLTVSCSSKSRLVLPSWFYLSGAGSPSITGQNLTGRKMVVCLCMPKACHGLNYD